MLHYSNASSIEKNRRYLVIKGGLAWKLSREGGVVNTVVVLGSSGVGLVVYQREEGEETMNTMQTDAWRCMTWQSMMLGVPNRDSRLPMKGGNIRENILGVSRFRTNESEGESCMFAMLGLCGGRTGCVSEFVSSFRATFMYKVFSSELRFILY